MNENVDQPAVSLLFVCHGNICRSPTAQGVCERQLRERGWRRAVHVESAGTSALHEGSPPDWRSQKAAASRGYDLAAQRSRRVESGDFHRFDLILAMDELNVAALRERMPGAARAQTRKLLDYHPGARRDVPDPYAGGDKGFELTLDLIEEAVSGLLDALPEEYPALRR